MQEKDKKQPRRTWRGFASADGLTDYTVFLFGDKIEIVAKQEIPGEDDEVIQLGMSVADFKHLMATCQDLLFESGDGVLRFPDKDATRG